MRAYNLIINGYFTKSWANTPSHVNNGADIPFKLNNDNSWPDPWDNAKLYGRRGPFGDGGSFMWDILGQWRVMNAVEWRNMEGWNQNFSIDANGAMTVSKFDHWVKRTMNNVITSH